VLIGRDPTAQVRIADTRSSRRHLMVEREAAGWPVRDLGTTNGTHLLDAGGRDRELRGDAIRKGFVAQLGSGDCVKLLTFDSTTSEGSGWLKATDPNLSATINKVTWKSAMTELLPVVSDRWLLAASSSLRADAAPGHPAGGRHELGHTSRQRSRAGGSVRGDWRLRLHGSALARAGLPICVLR
jgi:hypothetical protein